MSDRNDAKRPTIKDLLPLIKQLSLPDQVGVVEILLDSLIADAELDEHSAAELASRKQEIVNTFIASSLGIPVLTLLTSAGKAPKYRSVWREETDWSW